MVTGAVNLIPEEPIARMVELGLLAESLGYQRCWIYDEGLTSRDVHVVMSAIATATDRIGVGPGITNPYTRHPATTVAAIASLDELSDGRAFLGVGAGGSLTLDPLGLPRDRPLAAVRETISAARALFGGERVSYEGSTLTLDNALIEYGRGDIEIWLAGRGPKMLSLGGELCDGVMLDFIHKPQLGAVVDRVRRSGAEHGRQPKISYSTMVITSDDALASTKPHMTYRLVDSPASVKEHIGLSDTDCEMLRRAMGEGLDAAGELVRDEWVFPFVISGSVDECADEIDRLATEFGLDEFLLPVLDDANAETLMGVVADVLRLPSV